MQPPRPSTQHESEEDGRDSLLWPWPPTPLPDTPADPRTRTMAAGACVAAPLAGVSPRTCALRRQGGGRGLRLAVRATAGETRGGGGGRGPLRRAPGDSNPHPPSPWRLAAAEVATDTKSLEIMRKFSEQYAKR